MTCLREVLDRKQDNVDLKLIVFVGVLCGNQDNIEHKQVMDSLHIHMNPLCRCVRIGSNISQNLCKLWLHYWFTNHHCRHKWVLFLPTTWWRVAYFNPLCEDLWFSPGFQRLIIKKINWPCYWCFWEDLGHRIGSFYLIK